VSNSGATVGTFQKRVAGTFQGRRVVAWSGSGAPAIEMQLPARFAGRPGGLAAYTRLFLLQLPQVPEPTAASLLLLAAGCSCGVRRSRPNYMR
jgi:hypothetical protein